MTDHMAHNHAEGERDGHEGGWDLTLNLIGDSPGEIIETLADVVLPMLRGGIVHADNESLTLGTQFHFLLEPVSEGGLFLDGEGTVVAVKFDGTIASLIRPDGTEDDTAPKLKMSGSEWGTQHGGMTSIHELVGQGPGGRMPTELQAEAVARKIKTEGSSWLEGDE